MTDLAIDRSLACVECLSIEAVLNNKFTKALLQSKLEQEASQAVAGMFPPETMNTMAMRSIPRDGYVIGSRVPRHYRTILTPLMVHGSMVDVAVVLRTSTCWI